MEWKEVATKEEVPEGTIKTVEVKGEKIAIANVDGEFYAFKDRCGHMNAPLHRGTLKKNLLICPLHYATFDVTTGKKLGDPQMEMPKDIMEKLPQDFLEMWSRIGEIMSEIETHDLTTYETKVDNNTILVNV
jgi:nitrite reductase/ring-hydroxylating ferredoxin subunit